MAGIDFGYYFENDHGVVDHQDGTDTNFFNIDYVAVGAFSGVSGLPTEINNASEFYDYANALKAKTTEISRDAAHFELRDIYQYYVATGGTKADTIFAADPSNPVTADGMMVGRKGADTLSGGEGADTLLGGSGDDSLVGGKSADYLVGGTGVDLLASRGDGDRLSGGAGADTYRFDALSHQLAARIAHIESTDTIDLSAVDADTTQQGNQDFTQVSVFDGNAAELVVHYDAVNDRTTIYLDTDGDGAENYRISLKAADHSSFDNFVY